MASGFTCGRWIGFFVLGLLAAQLAGRPSSLIENSPFAPPENNEPGPAAPSISSLELRGIVSGLGETLFNIYDPERKTSVWVRMNQPGHPFGVTGYDPANGCVIVEQQGHVLTLALTEGQIIPAAQIEVKRRVEAAMDEINRRRARRVLATDKG